MRSRLLTLCAALALGSTACTEQPTEPVAAVAGPAATIIDAPRGGVAHFFFLPPMVPPPSYSGTFDPTLSPVVTICAVAADSCTATVVTFSGSQIQVQQEDQAYKVIWKTKGAGLDSETLYRVQVSVGGALLGYADAWVLNQGSTIRIVDQGKVVTTITTGQLSIRFRIEQQPPTTGTWRDGDYITYTQSEWGDPATAGGALLSAKFSTIFGSTPMQVGSMFPTGSALLFTSASAVHAFLPQLGAPGPIAGRYTDPLTTPGGVLAGEITALFINYIFSNAGHTPATGGNRFGDLVLCGFAIPSGLNGVVVGDFVRATMTILLNGRTRYQTGAELAQLAAQLNASFSNGVPSQFAQDHLVTGSCPGAWNRGDMLSFGADNYGTMSDVASTYLVSGFDAVYTGGLEVGLSGNTGFSMIFTSPTALIDYLPDCGVPGQLTSDLVNPTTTNAGCFGGVMVALQLNVDLADGGYLPAASGVRFGDLHICGVTDRAAIEGEAVRALLARALPMLSGTVPESGGPYTVDDLYLLIDDVIKGFVNGEASFWAREHLYAGACP